ncbi:hypothetical protein [Fulvivirga lutea]|uniref:Uncharacterized protein n=1 Tax=Fulvivirga lutea TaxID=2810512 RepID=A0A974WF23_9BACT|nr:hypothetical protein [Fulvivirga lutea]QSE96514.1 hypothetical protein JR347_13005 [Fulvivirga lutea]
MKLVLKDYIESLKEEGELDSLLTDLLWSVGIKIFTRPNKGTRQYGVDIAAYGKNFQNSIEDQNKEVFLITVKKGNFDRNNWDSGKNSIRQSLNDIIDVYIPNRLGKQYNNCKINIVVASNGELSEGVIDNWVSYTKEQGTKNDKLNFVFWGIRDLVQLTEDNLLSELLFPEDHRLLLRKTLSFLDLPDYDLRHFYELNEKLFQKCLPLKNNRKLIKNLRLLRLISNILLKGCVEMNNIKPAIIASERVLILYWDWFKKRNSFNEKEPIKELISYHFFKIQINRIYFAKVQTSYYSEDGLSFGIGNLLEYSLITYEQIGISATIGMSELYEAMVHFPSDPNYSETCYKNAMQVSQSLGELIFNNPASCYPKYDEHCIEINLAMILFYQTERFDIAIQWLEKLISYLRDNYLLKEFIPLFITDYEKLIQIEVGGYKEEISSSILITCLADWCIMLKEDNLYKNLIELIEQSLPNIDLQHWHPEENTEENLFNSNAMRETGSTRSSIKLPKNPIEYEMEMVEERNIFFDETKFLHNNKGFQHIEYLANRHFRTYVFPNSWRQLLNTRFCFNKP